MEITENVLTDNTHHTLKHIIHTFRRDIHDFIQHGDLSDHLYDALYDYYHDDMPYGVAKARSGDPYEWIGNRLHQDLHDHGMLDEGGITLRTGADGNLELDPTGHTIEKQRSLTTTPPAPPSAPSPVGECNYTMENRYCPKHGLKNCLDEAEYDLGYQDNKLPFVNPQANYVMPANAAEREQDVKDFGHLTKNLNLGNPNSIVNKNVTPSTTSVPFGQNNRTTTGYAMPANDAERAADLKDFGQLTNKFNLGSNKAAPTQNATPAPMEDRMFETELARIKALMK
jgi:hypothetical protein